jgi:hypothetical protein
MSGPIAGKLILPDDSGNTGKKIRTQTRVIGADTVHEHFYVPVSICRIMGIYHANIPLYTVANSAQNGTSAAIGWLQVPAAATVNARVRMMSVSHTNAVATAIDHATAPRIAFQRATFTGTPSGAVITSAKRATTDNAAQCDIRTASTGLTISLVANALVWASLCPGVDITTSGVYNSFLREEWRPMVEDEFIDLAPGEALAIYQIDAGTASDQRRALVNICWDEYDNT